MLTLSIATLDKHGLTNDFSFMPINAEINEGHNHSAASFLPEETEFSNSSSAHW
jgi:hypothetical protein